MLLAPLIHEAQLGGYRQLIDVIGDSPNVSSIRLHEKLGFTLVGTLQNVGFKFDRWVDTVLMQRALTPASLATSQPQVLPTFQFPDLGGKLPES